MRKIVGHQEAKSDGFSRTDAANGFQLGGWKLGYYVGEIAIVSGPQRDQQRPVDVLNGLHAYVSALIVTGELQRCLKSGPDESLMIV